MTYVLPEPDYKRLSDLQSGIDSWWSGASMRKAFAAGVAQEEAVNKVLREENLELRRDEALNEAEAKYKALQEEFRVLDVTCASVESENRELRDKLKLMQSILDGQKGSPDYTDRRQASLPLLDTPRPEDLIVTTFAEAPVGFAPPRVGIRVSHRPSGLVASSIAERSQHANRARAIEILYGMLGVQPTTDGGVNG